MKLQFLTHSFKFPTEVIWMLRISICAPKFLHYGGLAARIVYFWTKIFSGKKKIVCRQASI